MFSRIFTPFIENAPQIDLLSFTLDCSLIRQELLRL